MKKSPILMVLLAALVIATFAIAGLVASRPLANAGPSQATPQQAGLNIPF